MPRARRRDPGEPHLSKHKEAAKGPTMLRCEEVDVVAAKGRLVRSGCRLAEVEHGTVRCVDIKKLKIKSCRFGRRSGSS